MDHEVFEKQMIDGVNRNAEEKGQHFDMLDSTAETHSRLFTKADAVTLTRGLRRMVIALLTAVLFGIAVCGFIVTAIAPGYLAVLIFLMSIVVLVCAFVFLYAQGITHRSHTESQGDDK